MDAVIRFGRRKLMVAVLLMRFLVFEELNALTPQMQLPFSL